jgi:hypothetical protein
MSQNKKTKQLLENRHFSRRQFLIGSGYATLILPPLYSLMPSAVANAAEASLKRRAVIFMSYRGIVPELMNPNPADLTQFSGGVHTYYKPLSSFAGGNVSYMVDSSFQPLFPYMNLVRGLSATSGNYRNHNDTMLAGLHGGRHYNGGVRSGTSIDVIMENSSSVYAPSEIMPMKAVRISSGPEGMAYSYSMKNGAAVLSTGIYGDGNLFNKLFSGLPAKPVLGGSTPIPPSARAVNQKLIVDRVKSDLDSLKAERNLSSSDLSTLNDYIDGVHELQKKVAANALPASVTKPGACTKLDLPNFGFQQTTQNNPSYFPVGFGVKSTAAMFKNYNDMITLAFKCDLTRVVYIFNTIYEDAPVKLSTSGPLSLHHECPSREISASRHKWGLTKLRDLAMSLKNTADAQGGNILDNSILFYTNELGDWTTSHSVTSVPAITFGKGGGFFNTGYYVDYRQRPFTADQRIVFGRPYKQMLQSIMRSVGISEAEYSKYGAGAGGGFGDFQADVTQDNKGPGAYAAYKNEHNKALPFLTKG